MVNDSRTEVQNKTIDYSYKVFQELIGPDRKLTFEEDADNPKVIGNEYDVAVFEEIRNKFNFQNDSLIAEILVKQNQIKLLGD